MDNLQTGTDAGQTGPATPSPDTYEDKVAAAYRATAKVAENAVRLDYQFRNSRRELARGCANFILAAFDGNKLDVSLRNNEKTPDDVARVLEEHGLEPPVHWSFNPFLGVINHFYFNARLAWSEKGTGMAKEYPITEKEAEDEIEMGNEHSQDKAVTQGTPKITNAVAEGRADQTDGARWAMLSKFGRWVMIGIDMEDMSVFDMSYDAANAKYKTWLTKKVPFIEFLTEPVPDGFRKPSVARQVEKDAKKPGRPAKGAKPAEAQAQAAPAAAPTTGPGSPGYGTASNPDPSLKRVMQMTGHLPPDATDDRPAEDIIMEAAAKAKAERERGEQPVEATTTAEATGTVDTGETVEAASTVDTGETIEPTGTVETAETIDTQAQAEAVDEARAEAAEATAWQATVQPTVEPTTTVEAAPSIEPTTTTVEPVTLMQVAEQVAEPEQQMVTHMLSYSQFVSIDTDSLDLLPDEGFLSFRKTSDGKIEIMGWLEFQHKTFTR